MDPSRTKQGIINQYRYLFFLILIEFIHHDVVDSFQFILVFNGAEDFFAVFFYSLEDTDFKMLDIMEFATVRTTNFEDDD